MLERTMWLERVLAAANNILDRDGARITAARTKSFFEDFLLDRVEEYLAKSTFMESDHFDYIRHTGLKKFEPDWWKGRDHWDDVVFTVAFHCIAFDITESLKKIIEGKAPRRPSPLKDN